MKYFWLSAKDQRANNWIFYTDSNETGRRIRERFRGLQCPTCNKLDELAGLDLGIDPDVRIRSRSDFLRTDDGFICINARGRQIIEENNISGLRFIPIPGDDRYEIALPVTFTATDCDRSGMEFLSQCPSCKRFSETVMAPIRDSMTLSTDPLAVMCPDINFESIIGRDFWYFASQDVVNIFRKEKLSGIDFSEV